MLKESSLPSTFGRDAVLGLSASISLSANLFNPIAKFLALTAANTPNISRVNPNQPSAATIIAINIKGSEKMECSNITNSLKSLSLEIYRFKFNLELFLFDFTQS
jgi:hypothetical protein